MVEQLRGTLEEISGNRHVFSSFWDWGSYLPPALGSREDGFVDAFYFDSDGNPKLKRLLGKEAEM